MDDIKRFFQYEKEVAQARLHILGRLDKGEAPPPKKRTSKVEVAWHVLHDAGCPLHVSEIIERAKENYDVHLERDSIVSGILKKARTGKMFIKTAPNTFSAIPRASE